MAIKVEKVNWSDMTRTRTITSQRMMAREANIQATHFLRLIGIQGSADELEGIRGMLETGGNSAKRLLYQKLADIVSALSTYCSITVTHDCPAPGTINAGTEINALATFMSAQASGSDVNASIYQGKGAGNTGGTTNTKLDPGFN